MKKLLLATLLLLFTACGLAPVYNVEPTKIENPKSMEATYKAIKEAGQSLGWKIRKQQEGVAKGTLHLRSHVAVVRINYSASDYSITYVKSQNLKYDPETKEIHKNYNSWIKNLENAIDINL